MQRLFNYGIEDSGAALSVPDGEDVSRMRDVIASHLNRSASRHAPVTFD